MTSWYTIFRSASYSYLLGFIIWTGLLIIPIKPFTVLVPILVRGGPGIWLLLAYLLYLTIGIIGSGMLSSFLYVLETHERRVVKNMIMLPGFILLNIGIIASCVLLAIAGVLGGYSLFISNLSEQATTAVLSEFIYPITIGVILSIIGAILVLFSMITARQSSA